jgi:hypothetical protein
MSRIPFYQKSKSEKYKCAEFHFIKKVKGQFHNSILFRRGSRGRTPKVFHFLAPKVP